MHCLSKIREGLFEFWNLLFFFSSLIFIAHHFYFGLYHFHECDSSNVYEWMKYSSTELMNSHINSVTPGFLLDIRYKVAEFSQNISSKPMQKFFQLPYLSTYTPLMGMIYGQISINSFENFYRFASFANGLALQASSLLLYITCLKLNYSKPVSVLSSTLLLTFYATNSYSYHLGSTVWFILSISIGIFLLTVNNSFTKDSISFLMLFLSYPYLLWTASLGLVRSLYFYRMKGINSQSLLDLVRYIFKNRSLTIIGIIINLVLFFPFGSGDRAGPDLRGFYSIYSFTPLNNIDNTFAIIFSFCLHSLLLIAIFNTFNYFKSIEVNAFTYHCIDRKIDLKRISYINRYNVNIHCICFLIIFSIFVLLFQLTLATTRHSIFIIPAILTIASFGLEELIKSIKSRNILTVNKIISPAIAFLISLSLISSSKANFERVDVLKRDYLPDSITSFIKNSKDIDYSIVECSPHYLYANFTEKKFRYNLKYPHSSSNLYEPGLKLFISQRPSQFQDEFSQYLFAGKPSKGDIINVYSKDVQIEIVSTPFIVKSNIYFDSLNKNSTIYNLSHSYRKLFAKLINSYAPDKIRTNIANDNLNFKEDYDFYSKATGEEYRYPRPNNIWLIPIKVESLK